MKTISPNTCLIIGCGYLGLRVAHRWLDDERIVYALTRDAQRATSLEQTGLQAVVGDVTDPGSLAGLPKAKTVLVAVGLDRSAGKSVFDVYVEGLKNVLTRVADTAERIIYISSTGVYSHTDGQWIDEASDAIPTRDAGLACLQAEKLLTDSESAYAEKTIVLRLAGIYGPARVPQKKMIVDHLPIKSDPNGFLNLIHVDDAATAVVASETLNSFPEIILISDDQPVLRRDYYQEVARLYGAPQPQFETPDETTLRQMRGGTSKRVRNERMKALLNITLKYPSFREGLRHAISANESV